jgi:hypothetical protein
VPIFVVARAGQRVGHAILRPEFLTLAFRTGLHGYASANTLGILLMHETHKAVSEARAGYLKREEPNSRGSKGSLTGRMEMKIIS